MKTTRIDWDYSEEEIYAAFDKMSVAEGSSLLLLDEYTYKNMSEEERNNIISMQIRRNILNAEEILNLPQNIHVLEGIANIPDKEERDEAIADWLTQEYGTCIRGYELNTD